jgi:hypothetical protein
MRGIALLAAVPAHAIDCIHFIGGPDIQRPVPEYVIKEYERAMAKRIEELYRRETIERQRLQRRLEQFQGQNNQ